MDPLMDGPSDEVAVLSGGYLHNVKSHALASSFDDALAGGIAETSGVDLGEKR